MYSFTKLTDNNREDVINIFNFYVENGFSSFFEERVGHAFFDAVMQMIGDYPAIAVLAEGDRTVGFSFIRPYSPIPTFRRTGEITCFLAPEHTSQGLGTHLLQYMMERARELNIDTLLAFVAEKNEPSIGFHKKNGFAECGKFVRIGRKLNQDLTILCFQKFL